jgi:hypothetical protein
MRNRYSYIQGQRHRIGFSQSVPPIAADTNESFERRMEQMARCLLADGHTVELDFELRGDRLVACILDVTLAQPMPAPIGSDLRPVGQRRGSRGGGGSGQRKAA